MSTGVRTDLGGHPPARPGTPVARLLHMSDLHVLDAASPARGEWVELEADDPLFRPLLHMHRPYDALTMFAVHAHVQAVRGGDRAYHLVISTGDNIDNGQRNELDAYLALLAGGTARLSATGSAQDAPLGDGGEPWPYWSPDGRVADRWRAEGYPEVDDFVARASAPIVSTGLGLPWTSVPGNHDLLRQGTALETPAVAAIATGGHKSLRRPADFAPADPLALFIDEPEAFSLGSSFAIEADPLRRIIDREEWLAAHRAAGALGHGHARRDPLIDTVIELEHVRLILIDTNHPEGDFQGSVGTDQLAWLDERLAEVDADRDRVAVLVSHHGLDSLVNDRGHRADRHLAASMNAVVLRHPSAVAWLVGHRHLNRIDARPGASGGYWEITTCSIIDWPSQVRALDIARHADGSVTIDTTMLDHQAPDGSLAALHRRLAEQFAPGRMAAAMAGRAEDRDVTLVLPPR